MKLDFWNNPLVVSAFRVKYRRNSPVGLIVLYLLFLLTGAGTLEYSGLRCSGSLPLTYFVFLLGGQCVVSGAFAFAAGQSLRDEINQKTLDFQRITSLPPRAILLGKLLGEPAIGYLLGIATVPLAVLCCLWGATSFDVLALAYLNVASLTLMLGALSLRSELAQGDYPMTSKMNARRMLVILYMVPMSLFFLYGGLIANVVSVPWAAAVMGLILPITSFYGIATDHPYIALTWFGVEVPCLLVTPLAQAFIAFWCFRTMQRQLMHPLNPPASRPLTYLTLIGVDLVIAGVVFDLGAWSLPLGARSAAYWLVHLLVSLMLMAETTPHGPTLRSWVWRVRPTAGWRDRWLGDRSENGLALVAFAGIGVVGLLLFVVVPALCVEGPAVLATEGSVLLQVTALSVTLLLSVGTVYQFMVFRHGDSGAMLTALMVIVAVGVFQAAGYWLHEPFLLGLSPSAQFWQWLNEEPLPAQYLGPLLAACAGAWLLVRLGLRRRLRQLAEETDQKLKQMGAV